MSLRLPIYVEPTIKPRLILLEQPEPDWEERKLAESVIPVPDINTKQIVIQLTPTLRLKWDDLCISLDRLTTQKSGMYAGNQRWLSVAYYSGLEQACRMLLERHLPELSAKNVTDLTDLKLILYDAVKMLTESL